MPPSLTQISALCLLAGVAGLRGDDNLVAVKLTGIIHFEGKSRALFEITPQPGRPLTRPILAEGESVAGIEVRDIDAKSGRVRVLNGGVETFYVVDAGVPEAAARTFNLKAAHLSQVLDIYQELSARTVLAPTALPGAAFDLKTEKISRKDALTVLEETLRWKGIVMVPRAAKFVFAVRSSEVEKLSIIPEPPGDAPESGDVFPPGLIKFQNTEVHQALEIYQELSGRTLLEATRRTFPKITVRTQTELRRGEAVWLMSALFALADIAVIPSGEKFAFVFPGVETAQIPGIETNPAVAQIQRKDPLPAGMIRFNSADLDNVLRVYAALIEREPLPVDRTTPAVKVSIRSQTALAPAEAVFALDALAAVNRLKFVLVGEKQVKIIPAALARPSAP
jgi:hypothetical protein